MCDSVPWTPMNHQEKFEVASFIFGREIRNRTDKHTKKQTQTVNDIFTLCLSSCVDKKLQKATPV